MEKKINKEREKIRATKKKHRHLRPRDYIHIRKRNKQRKEINK